MNFRTFLPALALATLSTSAIAQCDTIASVCEKHITQAYIPDGQFYRALLSGEEMAEFNLTLFGGTTYRVAACSGLSDRNLVFSVLDRDRNVLFTNKEFSNDPYWDLVVANTIEVTMEAQLDPAKLGSGCAVLLIGFKK
ncbi:MAG: hypothetical protein IT229_11385 [Flavobacteriales bacterium]|nr:hypothetical protein [Flavobacteriales bacterium]